MLAAKVSALHTGSMAESGNPFDNINQGWSEPSPQESAFEPPFEPNPNDVSGPPKKSSWLKITIMVTLGVLAVIALLGFIFWSAVRGPIDEANNFLAAMKSKNYSAAYALTEPSCSSFDEAGLAVVFAGDEIRSYNLRQTNSTKSSGQNATGAASGEITFSDGRPRPITVFLTKFDEDWKVCGFGIGEP